MKTLNDEMKVMSKKVNTSYTIDKNFHEALKIDGFKEFLDLLKVEERELKINTSSLKESFSEYKNCQDCPGIMACKNKEEGFAYLPKILNGHLKFGYKACRYQEEILKKKKYLDNITLFNVPAAIRDAQFKDIYTKPTNRKEVIKWLKNFITEYKEGKAFKGLYLHGNFGCGKSYLVAATFMELAKENYPSAIVFWPEFLNDLKSSFANPYSNEFDIKMNTIKNAPLLLIDDIGAENTTPWSRDDILCPIVQYRMDAMLPTFFTSNLDIKALEEHLSVSKFDDDVVKARRIVERIKQLTVETEMISENLRK